MSDSLANTCCIFLSAVQPVAGQRLPDKVLSLVLAEVAGGKRRDWKALLHRSTATLRGKVDDGRV